MAENFKHSLMAKLLLNPATKKALKASDDKAAFIRDYLLKNYTVVQMTDIISSYYLDETSNVPRVKISKKQLDEFFNVIED